MSSGLNQPMLPPASLPGDPAGLARTVLELTRTLGFATAGIAAAAPSTEESRYRQWIAAGKHGEMDYLATQADARVDVSRELPGCRSVLLVAEQYAPRGSPPVPAPPGHGKVARYARGRDYHLTIKQRLHRLADTLRARWPEHQFRSFADTAPILEREQAVRCGIGWIGKHTLVINPRLGSYFLLGGMLTTMDWQPTRPAAEQPDGLPPLITDSTDRCGSCTRCIDACPTGAITPYSVDARRCVSYLTIEHRSPTLPMPLPHDDRWIYGCDICQEVCPHNTARGWETPIGSDFATSRAAALASLDLAAIMAWDQPAKAAAVEGTPMRRTKLEQFQRNARMLQSRQSPPIPPSI